ncbi:MAG: hypothetical protein JW863_16025 [Chitinispirillaceae bacterium]|nr:hypothetical protein [Chitinispirillaceae bacterium]
MEYAYEFAFENGRKETFALSISDTTLLLAPLPVDSDEEWMQLTFHQCSVCTLSSSEHTHCPVAKNLSYLLSRFKNNFSHETVTARVTTKDRITEKTGSLETCASSIIGLIMATSGCPVLDILRPMAYTHLPFANEDETIFRAVSTYLTAQAIKESQGLKPDWEIKNVADIYSGITRLNANFTERLRGLRGKDANINAIISLDLFAQLGTFTLPTEWMEQVKGFFASYLKDG